MSRSHLLLPVLTSITVGCTTPNSRPTDTLRPVADEPPFPSGPSVAIAPPPTATALRYMACGDPGHIVLEVGPQYGAHLASRGPIGLSQTIDGADWELGESQPGDVSQELTYDSRRRTETPQLLAFRRSTAPVLWVSSSGIDKAAQLSVLGRLADATPDAGPAHHHQIGSYHLHLPWAGAFSGGGFSTAEADYSARFVPYSVWNPDASTRATVAGYTVFVVESQEPLHGEEGGPMVPLWHAETTIGFDLLEVHGRGTGVDRTSFLDATASFIRAAAASPPPPAVPAPARPAPDADTSAAFDLHQDTRSSKCISENLDLHPGSLRHLHRSSSQQIPYVGRLNPSRSRRPRIARALSGPNPRTTSLHAPCSLQNNSLTSSGISFPSASNAAPHEPHSNEAENRTPSGVALAT